MSIPETVPTSALLFALLSDGHTHGQIVFDEEDTLGIAAEDAAGEHDELARVIREEIGRDYPSLGAVLHEAMWQAWLYGFDLGYESAPRQMPAQGCSGFSAPRRGKRMSPQSTQVHNRDIAHAFQY